MIDICKLSMIKTLLKEQRLLQTLSKYLENWLDGIKQKEKAQKFVQQASVTSAKEL